MPIAGSVQDPGGRGRGRLRGDHVAPVSVCTVSTIGSVRHRRSGGTTSGLGIDRFPDGAQDLQVREVVASDVAPLHERPDRGGGGVELGDAMPFADVPESILGREVRCAFVHQGRDAVRQAPVDDVAVSGDATSAVHQ